jgi:hypothetical protein
VISELHGELKEKQGGEKRGGESTVLDWTY